MTAPALSGSTELPGIGAVSASCSLWLASRFSGQPAQGDAAPSGSADYGPITSGATYGGPGAFTFTSVRPTYYYLQVFYSGTNYWSGPYLVTDDSTDWVTIASAATRVVPQNAATFFSRLLDLEDGATLEVGDGAVVAAVPQQGDDATSGQILSVVDSATSGGVPYCSVWLEGASGGVPLTGVPILIGADMPSVGDTVYLRLKDQSYAVTEVYLRVDDGWTPDFNGAWTWISATSASVVGDRTGVYRKGTRFRCTQGGTIKYGTVVASSFSGGVTTVTLAANTDYSLANAAIADVRYSYQQTPAGYPTWFNFTSTPTGYSANPTTVVDRFKIDGNTVTWAHREGANGTSNATTTTYTLPVTAATIANMIWDMPALVVDNTVTKTTPGIIRVSSAGTTASAFVDYTGGTTGWTASGGKRVASFTTQYEI